jgi:hypothetical protein
MVVIAYSANTGCSFPTLYVGDKTTFSLRLGRDVYQSIGALPIVKAGQKYRLSTLPLSLQQGAGQPGSQPPMRNMGNQLVFFQPYLFGKNKNMR